jgi:hypothetical protein
VSWPSKFAKIETNSARTMTDFEIVEDDVLNTTYKHCRILSPAKVKVTEVLLDKIALVDMSHRLIKEFINPQFNDKDGESMTTPNFSFTQDSYEKVCSDIYDKVDMLAENSKCLGDVIIWLQPFIESQTKPMENIISGLRSEMVSIKGQMGNKDLARKDIPPCIWNAVETGFDSFLSLDEKVEKVETIATEAHEVAGALLSLEESTQQPPSIKDESLLNQNVKSKSSSSSHIVNGKIYHPTKKFRRR